MIDTEWGYPEADERIRELECRERVLEAERDKWLAEATRADKLLHRCQESRYKTASFEDSLQAEIQRLRRELEEADHGYASAVTRIESLLQRQRVLEEAVERFLAATATMDGIAGWALDDFREPLRDALDQEARRNG